MFCSNCGAQNPDGMKFCSSCGAPLAAARRGTTVLNTPPVQTVQYSPIFPEQPPKKKNTALIAGIAGGVALLLVIIGVVLFFVLGDSDKDDKNTACSANIENIKGSVVYYYVSFNEIPSIEDLSAMFESYKIPVCPHNDREYTINIGNDGTSEVICNDPECGNYGSN